MLSGLKHHDENIIPKSFRDPFLLVDATSKLPTN